MVTAVSRIVVALALFASAFRIFLWACPFFVPQIVTTFARHPDQPRTKYVAGNLGVVLPSYASSYQVIAYRYFEGIGMTPGEQSQANLYYRDKQVWQNIDPTAIDWSSEWKRLSSLYLKPPAQPVDARRWNDERLNYELNCADDAFRVASFTLKDRLRLSGPQSAFFLNWIAAQHAVFSNCSGVKGDALPSLPSNAPQWLQRDRAYQQAAWHFYRGEKQPAIAAFRKVAADPASPWRILARYLVIRVMTRGVQRDSAELPAVLAEIDQVLKSNTLSSIHGPTRALRRRNLIVASPATALNELNAALTSKGMDLSLRQDLWDFVHLYAATQRSPNTSKLASAEPLSNWLKNFQSPSASSASAALEQWQKSKQPAWLVATVSNAIASDASIEDLLADAATIPDTHPAFPAIAYHRARILCDLRRYDAAWDIADTLWRKPNLPQSSRNLFAMIRARSAADLPSFLLSLPVKPVAIDQYYESSETQSSWEYEDKSILLRTADPVIGYAQARALNFDTDLKSLSVLALGSKLPAGLSTEIQTMALMRALILKRSELYRPLAQALANSVPQYTSPLNQALRASNDDDLRDALLHFTISRPDFRPHLLRGSGMLPRHGKVVSSYTDFWPELKDRDSLETMQDANWSNCITNAKDLESTSHRALEANSATARAEWLQLMAAGSAGKFYMHYANEFYGQHPRDPRNAQLLGNAVRVWNNSRAQKEFQPLANKVWRTLQLKYPNSPLAVHYRAGVMAQYERYELPSLNLPEHRNHFPGVKCRFSENQ